MHLLRSAVSMTHVFGKGLWWVMRTIGFTAFGWNTIKGFNRSCVPLSDTLQAGAWLFPRYRKWPDHVGRFWPIESAVTRSFPPVPAFGSIWVVLWLLFPQRRGYLLGVCFLESLVFRLHSEIDQIHLSIEAQCGTTYTKALLHPRHY